MVESIRIGSSSNSRTQNRPKYPKILYKKKQFKSLPPASHEVVSDAVGWVASESKACCFPPASQQNGPTALELPSPSIPPTYPGGSASLCVVWLTNGSRPPEWWQAPGLTRDIIEDCWWRLKAEAMEQALRFLGQSIQGCQSQDARKPFSSWRLQMWKRVKSDFCFHRRGWENDTFPTECFSLVVWKIEHSWPTKTIEASKLLRKCFLRNSGTQSWWTSRPLRIQSSFMNSGEIWTFMDVLLNSQ